MWGTKNISALKRDSFNLSNFSTGNVSKQQFGEFLDATVNLSKIHRKADITWGLGHCLGTEAAV